MPASQTNSDPPSFPGKPKRSSKGKLWVRILLLVAVLTAAFFWRRHLGDAVQSLLDTVDQLGPWAPLIFVLVYAVATVAMIPGSLLTLFAGTSFGLVWGCLWASLGATLGATAAFLVGRHLARSWVEKKMKNSRRLAALDQAVTEGGWKMVALTRLSPLFPFTVLNYAFGLTRIPLGPYILASWIGMIPGTVLYVYLGTLGQAVARSNERSTGEWILFGVGLVATLAVTILITRNAKRALKRQWNPSQAS